MKANCWRRLLHDGTDAGSLTRARAHSHRVSTRRMKGIVSISFYLFGLFVVATTAAAAIDHPAVPLVRVFDVYRNADVSVILLQP